MKFKHLLVAGLLATTAASPVVHASDFFESQEEKKPSGVNISKEDFDHYKELEDVTLPALSNEKKQVTEELKLVRDTLGKRVKEVSSLREKLNDASEDYAAKEKRLNKEIQDLTDEKESAEQKLKEHADKLKTHTLVQNEHITQNEEDLRLAKENLAQVQAEYQDLEQKIKGKTVIENADLEELKRNLSDAENDVKLLEQNIQAKKEELKKLGSEADALKDEVTNLKKELQTAEDSLAQLKADHKKDVHKLEEEISARSDRILELEKKVNELTSHARAFHGTLNPILDSMERMLGQAITNNLGADPSSNPQAAQAMRSVMYALMSNAEGLNKSDGGKSLGISALDAMFASVFNVLVNKKDLSLFTNIAYSGEEKAGNIGISLAEQFVAENTSLKDLDITKIDGAKVEGAKKSDSSDPSKPKAKKKKKSSEPSKEEKSIQIEKDRLALEAEEEKKREQEKKESVKDENVKSSFSSDSETDELESSLDSSLISLLDSVDDLLKLQDLFSNGSNSSAEVLKYYDLDALETALKTLTVNKKPSLQRSYQSQIEGAFASLREDDDFGPLFGVYKKYASQMNSIDLASFKK